MSSETDVKERTEAVRAAVGSAALEGVVVVAETLEVLTAYASGAIDGDEMVDRVLAMHVPPAGPRARQRL